MVAIVFMVAGMSSRFGGKPKQFAKVGPNNETLIEYSVNQALKQPFSALYFICNPKTEIEFRKTFGNIYQGRQVHYIYQHYDITSRTKPWGTIDAIAHLYKPNALQDTYLIVNGDDIYGEETFRNGFNKFNQSQSQSHSQVNFIGTIPLSQTIPKEGNVNRGVIWTSSEDLVTKMEEKMNISANTIHEFKDMYANVNFIGLHSSTLKDIYDAVERFKLEHQGKPNSKTIECLLPDIFTVLIKDKNLKLEILKITNPIYGITNPEDEETLRNILSTS